MKSGNIRRGRLEAHTVGVCVLLCVGAASAQMRPDEVLVVYDGRIADSVAVAEYYAGSAAVPGGVGGLAGKRPGVRVMDLARTGAPVTGPGNIAFSAFAPSLRDPIRTFLTNTGTARAIRCLVLTKGLPHRVLDSDNPTVGDFPAEVSNEVTGNDYTCASVDSELTLLWQDLSSGENGSAADSKADGCIINPFWRSAVGIGELANTNITAPKTLTGSGIGPLWGSTGTGSARLGAGEIYLVCRLDGKTVADVRGMIDRAQHPYLDTQGAAVILDESNSNGVTDLAANDEYDNSASAFGPLRDSDDYEKTRDVLSADRRWLAANIRYNALSAFNQFFVGPRLSWQTNHGILVSTPVALLASYGLNHIGQPLTTAGDQGGTVYPLSFNYPAVAVFNSLESFNCRDFGGLGTLSFARQGQASDFISAGGTYAVGNVWEPLADTVPDNRFIVQNFLLGGMSWAEAAWSAIPALSWQQIAVGDPLARVIRSSEDVNGDREVDSDDLYAWEQTPTDIDRNGTIDANDRALLIRSIRGADRSTMLSPR